MDLDKAIERDLKRFDEITAQFERTALVLGFVNLFAAGWARAPGFQINPASAIGLSVTGFNVGYAIVYGPLMAVITLLIYRGLIMRRDAMRRAIVQQLAGHDAAEALSLGDQLQLRHFNSAALGLTASRADRCWRAFWYFVVPPAAAFVLVLRYFQFLPNDAAKAWSGWERARFLLFEWGGWELRPILPVHDLEASPELMSHLPYIYAPLESWAEIACCLLAIVLAWRAAWTYFDYPAQLGDDDHTEPAVEPG